MSDPPVFRERQRCGRSQRSDLFFHLAQIAGLQLVGIKHALGRCGVLDLHQQCLQPTDKRHCAPPICRIIQPRRADRLPSAVTGGVMEQWPRLGQRLVKLGHGRRLVFAEHETMYPLACRLPVVDLWIPAPPADNRYHVVRAVGVAAPRHHRRELTPGIGQQVVARPVPSERQRRDAGVVVVVERPGVIVPPARQHLQSDRTSGFDIRITGVSRPEPQRRFHARHRHDLAVKRG